MSTEVSVEPQPAPRSGRSRLRRILGYAGGTVLALIGALVLLSLAVGIFEGVFSSSSSGAPGDPSSAGVIDSAPFWSPDSRLIAFDRSAYGSPDDADSGAADVFVADAEGRTLRRLTRTPASETVLGWLSNPLRVVYSTYLPKGRTGLYALDLDGGARVELGEVQKTDEVVALSHDARRALVGTPFADPKRYVLVDLVRRTRRALPGTPPSMMGYGWGEGAWSRDDSMLAYLTDEGIVILRGERVLRRLPLGTGGLAWSTDGRRLAYADGGVDASSLWVVRIGDGSRTQLVGGEDNNVYAVWAPDGSRIYYEHGSFDDSDGLRAIAPDGTADAKITNNDWAGGGLFDFEGKNDRWLDTARISPDGTRIAYLLGQRGAWKNWSLVGVMNTDGSGKSPVPASL